MNAKIGVGGKLTLFVLMLLLMLAVTALYRTANAPHVHQIPSPSHMGHVWPR